MPSYIAESYLSRARSNELASKAARARDAAQALSAEGHDVAYLRTAFVPEDEVCLQWFIAPSPAAVTELARLAKLEFDRVIEEVEQPPHQSDSDRATAIPQHNHQGGNKMSVTTHSKAIARLALPLALAAGAISAPVAIADTGQPPQGGGCHMVFGPAFHSPNSNGLNNMMAGSANGSGAQNMRAMLSKFSDQQFCGL